jgi:hypothetical protein
LRVVVVETNGEESAGKVANFKIGGGKMMRLTIKYGREEEAECRIAGHYML